MKVNAILAAFAVVSMGGVSVALAEDTSAASTEKAAAPAAETMKVFIVTAKGGGWGASKAVRAAIGSQKGIESYKMSGMRTTVVMKDGLKLDAAKLKEEFAKGPVSFVSLEEQDQAVPKAAYTLMVKGAGWATTNDKARVALEKLPGISAAYVNRQLEIHLSQDTALDEKAVKDALATYKIEVSSVKKMEL